MRHWERRKKLLFNGLLINKSYPCFNNANFQVSGISTYNVDYPKEYSKYRIKVLDTSPIGTYVQVNQLDFYYLK